VRRLLSLLIAVAALALATGCSEGGAGEAGEPPAAGEAAGGGTESGTGTTEGETATPPSGPVVVGWIFPATDTTDAASTLAGAFPGEVETVVETNVTDPAAAVQSLVSQGAGLLLSELPGACAAAADLPCLEPGTGEPPEPSTITLDAAFWNRAYLLGLAAGLLTETEVTGFLVAGDSPREHAAVNAWALGCQSANPNCLTRLAVVEPGGEKKALGQLGKQNVDVLGTTVVGLAQCKPAGERLLAIQPLLVPGDLCGRALAVESLAEVATPLVEELLAGAWQGGGSLPLPLGEWTPRVPADVAAEVDGVAARIEGGENVFAGPLYDNQGTERVSEGEELTEEFLASQWDWYLGGVLTG
jgi:hypothetical protein